MTSDYPAHTSTSGATYESVGRRVSAAMVERLHASLWPRPPD